MLLLLHTGPLYTLADADDDCHRRVREFLRLEHDGVRHGHEGGQTTEQLFLHRCVLFTQLEQSFEHALPSAEKGDSIGCEGEGVNARTVS